MGADKSKEEGGKKPPIVVTNLSELGRAVDLSIFSRPDLPDLSGLTADEEVADEIREHAEKIFAWVKSTLAQMQAISKASREAQERKAGEVAEAEKGIRDLLSDETPAYRRAALRGILAQRLSAAPQSKKEALDIVEGLISDGYLERAETGPISAAGGTFSIPDKFACGQPEYEELAKALRSMAVRGNLAERQARREGAEALFERSELTLEQFLRGDTGKTGLIAFGVPPEPMVDRGGNHVLNSDGEIRWRGGGTLLFQSDGEKCWPVDVSGPDGFMRAVNEAMALRVHLLLRSLSWDRPPVPNLDVERGRKVKLLWYLLKRSITAMQQSEERKKTKVEMAAPVEDLISPEAFFLEGASGSCLVEFDGLWQPPLVAEGERPVYIQDLFFLVKRFEQGEGDEAKKFIRLVEVPVHINGYLGACVGTDYPESERFSGVAYPLRAVLQACYRQAIIAAQLAKKNYGPNNGK